MFRNLCEKYGWTFQDVGQLTMYQALVAFEMWCPEDIFEKKGPK